jgi:hypothetical protein
MRLLLQNRPEFSHSTAVIGNWKKQDKSKLSTMPFLTQFRQCSRAGESSCTPLTSLVTSTAVTFHGGK